MRALAGRVPLPLLAAGYALLVLAFALLPFGSPAHAALLAAGRARAPGAAIGARIARLMDSPQYSRTADAVRALVGDALFSERDTDRVRALLADDVSALAARDSAAAAALRDLLDLAHDAPAQRRAGAIAALLAVGGVAQRVERGRAFFDRVATGEVSLGALRGTAQTWLQVATSSTSSQQIIIQITCDENQVCIEQPAFEDDIRAAVFFIKLIVGFAWVAACYFQIGGARILTQSDAPMSVRFGLHAAAIALQLGVGAAAAVLVSNVDPGQAISSDTSAWPLITAIPATAVAVIDGVLWLCDNIIRENVDFFARPTEWIDDSDEGKRVMRKHLIRHRIPSPSRIREYEL